MGEFQRLGAPQVDTIIKLVTIYFFEGLPFSSDTDIELFGD